MNQELAEHISLIAAPLYAAFLARVIVTRVDNDIPIETLIALRRCALEQAQALWLDVLESRESG